MDDFLVRDGNAEFRPLDLCFSPDGRSMYVADWNVEIFTSPEIRGRLFRVRYVGTDVPAEPPRASDDAPLATQLKALGHPADSERAQAQACLTPLAEPAIAPLTSLLASTDAPKLAKVHALWALGGIMDRASAYDAATAWIAALDDPDADVRSQAARRARQARSPRGDRPTGAGARRSGRSGADVGWHRAGADRRRVGRAGTLSSAIRQGRLRPLYGHPSDSGIEPVATGSTASGVGRSPGPSGHAGGPHRGLRRRRGGGVGVGGERVPTRHSAFRPFNRWPKSIAGPIPIPTVGGGSSRPRGSRLGRSSTSGHRRRKSCPRFAPL